MSKDPRQIRCKIFPVLWNTALFEQQHGNITIYALELIAKNFTKGIDVDREDVEHNWWWLVDQVFSKGDPRRNKYMSQVSHVSTCSHMRHEADWLSYQRSTAQVFMNSGSSVTAKTVLMSSRTTKAFNESNVQQLVQREGLILVRSY